MALIVKNDNGDGDGSDGRHDSWRSGGNDDHDGQAGCGAAPARKLPMMQHLRRR